MENGFCIWKVEGSGLEGSIGDYGNFGWEIGMVICFFIWIVIFCICDDGIEETFCRIKC